MHRNTIIAVFAAVALFVVAGSGRAEAAGDTTITDVVVNGGQNVAVGTTYSKTFTVTVTATDDSGIKTADFYLYGPAAGFAGPSGAITCTGTTSATCTGSFTVDPRVDLYHNDQAGTWYVAAQVEANDGDFVTSEGEYQFKLRRYSKLTGNASPEPVANGATVTIAGALTRASWETRNYTGYSGQSVTLQFRLASGSTYNNVKTVTSSSTGSVSTTTTATADGCWRFSFAGTTTTSPVTSTADCVDVQ
ncbi:MAG TPA: hypothetical protein VHJ83_05905 [Micromonosporaceae bacterium]|jgi:hypothetical protein|nr:hypothetical protein [Micromonosporaceae bacterium]